MSTFIKLTNAPSYKSSEPTNVWINSDHIVAMISDSGSTEIATAIDRAGEYKKVSAITVRETPEQIIELIAAARKSAVLA